MIEIRRCTPEDWAYLAMYHANWAARYEHVFAPQAEVYSGFVDGQMVGAAGFLFHAPRQAYCWAALLLDRWPRYPRRLLEAIMAQRDAVIAAHGLWRLEARADCAHWQACRFLEALGFSGEGLLRASNEWGEDQFLYSYIPPDGEAERQQRFAARYGIRQDIQRLRGEYIWTQIQDTLYGPPRHRRGRVGGRCGDRGHDLIHPGLAGRSA